MDQRSIESVPLNFTHRDAGLHIWNIKPAKFIDDGLKNSLSYVFIQCKILASATETTHQSTWILFESSCKSSWPSAS
jgi:hypothetical protein